MDLNADEVINVLFSDEAVTELSDTCKVDEIEDVMKLPPWYDDKKFKEGQRYYNHNLFTMGSAMLAGLIAVLAIPSIINILISTKKSSSNYTAYKRYISTLLHVRAWFECDLKPGSTSWRSLEAVRSRHLRASITAQKRGIGKICQRDLALTQYGFVGFAVTEPDLLCHEETDDATLEGFVHFWAVIGYVIGIKDKYNICRLNLADTRKVCDTMGKIAFAPCLQNTPEYFVYMTDALIDGMWSFNPFINYNSYIYLTKLLAGVPGYVYTDEQRLAYKKKLIAPDNNKQTIYSKYPQLKKMNERNDDFALPVLSENEYSPEEFDSLTSVPAYKRLTFYEKYKLNFLFFAFYLYKTYIGRIYFNTLIHISRWLITNFPFLAYIRYGIKNSHIYIFKESSTDNAKPLKNSEMVNNGTWYEKYLPFKK